MRTVLRLPAIASALLVAGLAAGCSAGPAVEAKDQAVTAPTTSAAAPTTSAAPSTTPAPAATTAPAVQPLEGTTWSGPDSDGDDYTYRFTADGTFGYTSPGGSYDQPSDTWSLSGDKVTLTTNNGYSTRTGTISGSTISGTASNIRGHTWTWSATRQ